MTASNLTGYGPRLYFSGDENKYELWETKFLGHMRIQKMYGVFKGSEEPTEANNALAYAQLIQYLDDRSLSLIILEASDYGRKALKILNEHYLGKGKPRIINLYTQQHIIEEGRRRKNNWLFNKGRNHYDGLDNSRREY